MLESAGWSDSLVLGIVGQHHERLDGSGYPHGLVGRNILAMAQLVSLVDAYDALTCPRPYRAAYLPFAALRILKDEVETDQRYNRDYFVALIELLGKEDISIATDGAEPRG